jgi:hypothetical protein
MALSEEDGYADERSRINGEEYLRQLHQAYPVFFEGES